jgi:O-glycosyl hydrolase
MNFKSLLIPLLFTFGTVSAQTYQIHVDQTNQEIDNFGASDCWTMYKFGKYATEANINKVADLLFSKDLDANGKPKGIGLSLWRVNFGAGSDDNVSGNFRDVRARTPCIMKSDGIYDLSLTGKCGGQFNFLKKAKERGCEYTLGFVNSPPYFMTITGQTNGGTTYDKKLNLDNAGIQNFAEYLSEVLRRTKAEHGVTFDYVAPVNEPEWVHSSGDGMNATNKDIKNICVALDSKLTSKNITTKILIPEAGKIQMLNTTPSMDIGFIPSNYGLKIRNLFGNTSSTSYVGNLSTVARITTAHGYWSAAASTAQLVDLRTPIPAVLSQYNTKYWETERSIGLFNHY